MDRRDDNLDDDSLDDSFDTSDLEDGEDDSFDDFLRDVVGAPSVALSRLEGSIAGGVSIVSSRAEGPVVLDWPLALGAFEIHRRIGKGGMGEVWGGLHLDQNVPVAIKVVSGGRARQPIYQTAFRNEVRAAARLTHPGIVMVFDYGEINAEVERHTGGHLVAGSPYLAMEFASQGSLAEHPPAGWDAVRRVLLELLDALAHAHARGVIHRDLKPANVLLSGPDDIRPGIKVADFGLAHAMDHNRRGRTEAIRGTPHYMAPEQVTGEFRDHGPWTDLYAVGCMAWQWTTGAPPFDAPTLLELTQAHLGSPVPLLRAQMEIPDGFEVWVSRLLEKSPRRRFQSAAEASWALGRLGPPRPGSASAGSAELEALGHMDTHVSELVPMNRAPAPTHDFGTLSGTMSGSLPALAPPPQEAGVPPVRTDRPALPASWTSDAPLTRSMQLVGAGLGLYGLRTIPMVGRDSERDALWQALRACEREGRAHMALLTGSAGAGKSRIAEWLCERAQELAGVSVLRAAHSPMGGPADGLPRMVARALQCTGLDRPEVLARTERILREQGVHDPFEANALTELMLPASEQDAPSPNAVRFRSPREWHVVVRRLVERHGRQRPVIVWLDDVQWGADALDFAEHLLGAQAASPSPVLLLLTARNESLPERPVEARQFEELAALPEARHIDVPALSSSDTHVLVSELLGLEGDLAGLLEERCAGNPLFAVQLVNDWVERGVLEVGTTGFTLRRGEAARLPDDIHHVWAGRIERLLNGYAPEAGIALEIAAVLGHELILGDWEAACELFGLTPPPRLLDQLLDNLLEARLAQPTDQGWAFVHGMLRESLERRAREANRLEPHNAACATMLQRRYAYEARGIAERIGRHLLAAGRVEDALTPLKDGIHQRNRVSQYQASLAIYAERERALRQLNAPEDDYRCVENLTGRAHVLQLIARHDVARQLATRAEGIARAHGWTALLARANQSLGHVARHQGNFAEAEARFGQALDLAEQVGDLTRQAESTLGLATVALSTGRYDDATALARRAMTIHERRESPSERAVGAGACLQTLAIAAVHTRRLAEASALYRQALQLYETVGSRLGMAICFNGLAEVQRFDDDLEAAADGYRRALTHYEAAGSGEAIVPRLNLGLVLLRRGEFSECQTVLKAGQHELESTSSALVVYVYAALLPCYAHASDWEAWDKYLTRLTDLLTTVRLTDADLAWPMQLAGEVATQRAQPERARRAFQIALDQWRALGKTDEATALARQLER